jgi:hypothetical protein
VKQTKRLKSSLKLGVIIALTGMFITLMGAEQIVGTLVAKAITGAFPEYLLLLRSFLTLCFLVTESNLNYFRRVAWPGTSHHVSHGGGHAAP